MFKRGKKEGELEWPTGLKENVKAFCVFGSWIVGCCDTQLLVWKSAAYELYTILQGSSPVPFTGCMTSLPTFLNKILVGREDGTAEIWNVSSGKLVYTLLPPAADYGAISALQPTPALSLVAIAYETGPLIIQDIRTDTEVIRLNSSGTPITSISFRTDGLGAGDDGRKAGVMATASSSIGDVTLWDLNNGGRKAGVLRGAHDSPTKTAPGGVSKIKFLAGQAVLVSSGLDNSLKTWIFDETPFSAIPRTLHQRSGHGAPVTRLMFLPSASDGSDDNGKWLMSASKDRSLWGWSLRRDGQSTELSQGNVNNKAKKQGLLAAGDRQGMEDLKAPPITCIACSLNRDGGIGAMPGKQPIWHSAGKLKGKSTSTESSAMTGWESVLTGHEGDKKARTWFWGRKRAGRWAFETGDGGNVSSVAISPCGTFALVGSDQGGIDMFNLQSGIHRTRFPARLTPMQAKQLRVDLQKDGLLVEDDGKKKFYRGQGKHTSAVTGLAVDSLNKTVISAGADGKIKFWDFSTGLLRHQIDWSTATGITGMKYHRSSELAAFLSTDGCIRVVDTSTCKLIRELWPSRSANSSLQGRPIADFCFSNDGRWITAASEQLVFVWDLPTGHLIDAFKLLAACTALAFSPTGEFLATASADSVGVDIWSNRTLFTHVPTRHITDAELEQILAFDAQAPTASGEGSRAPIADATEEVSDDEDVLLDSDLDNTINNLSSSLLSLSLVPRSRWQNLLHLDLIRQRNKPIAPPKKPEKAPFFLPSLQDRQAVQSASAPEQDLAELEKERSRIVKMNRTGAQSAFTSLLVAAGETDDFVPFVEHFKGLSPAAADVEIRSLSGEGDELVCFVRALVALLRSRRDFELGQAWMAVFLRVHGDVVVEDEDLRAVVEEWQAALSEEMERVQRLVGYCGGLVGFLRAARV